MIMDSDRFIMRASLLSVLASVTACYPSLINDNMDILGGLPGDITRQSKEAVNPPTLGDPPGLNPGQTTNNRPNQNSRPGIPSASTSTFKPLPLTLLRNCCDHVPALCSAAGRCVLLNAWECSQICACVQDAPAHEIHGCLDNFKNLRRRLEEIKLNKDYAEQRGIGFLPNDLEKLAGHQRRNRRRGFHRMSAKTDSTPSMALTLQSTSTRRVRSLHNDAGRKTLQLGSGRSGHAETAHVRPEVELSSLPTAIKVKVTSTQPSYGAGVLDVVAVSEDVADAANKTEGVSTDRYNSTGVRGSFPGSGGHGENQESPGDSDSDVLSETVQGDSSSNDPVHSKTQDDNNSSSVDHHPVLHPSTNITATTNTTAANDTIGLNNTTAKQDHNLTTNSLVEWWSAYSKNNVNDDGGASNDGDDGTCGEECERQGGRCVFDFASSYTQVCVRDSVQPCHQLSCVHGTCVSRANSSGYSCQCDDGWAGIFCDKVGVSGCAVVSVGGRMDG